MSEVPLELDRGEDMTLKVLKIPKFTHKIYKVITASTSKFSVEYKIIQRLSIFIHKALILISFFDNSHILGSIISLTCIIH